MSPCLIHHASLFDCILFLHFPHDTDGTFLILADRLGRDDEFERSLYYYAFGTREKQEGVAAFLEKRAPDWTRK